MLCAAGSVILTFVRVSAAALDSTGPACTDAKCKNQILRRSMPLEVVCIGMTSASVVSFTMTVVCAQIKCINGETKGEYERKVEVECNQPQAFAFPLASAETRMGVRFT